MTNKNDKNIEQELRQQQKFTVAGAIGRAGKGLMKGASPISVQEQACKILQQWIQGHVPDPSGALKEILKRRVQAAAYPNDIDPQNPYSILCNLIETLLASEYQLKEFVRQVDIRWGELYQERPRFEREGQQPDPDDEYTFASVRQILNQLQEKLKAE